MLSIKEVIEKFEVTRATLHNWKTTKPNLYNYLVNSDDKFDELRDLTILIEKYSKNIKSNFLIEEIEYILNLNLENLKIEDIEQFHTIYSHLIIKDLKQNSEFLLEIYQKIKNLNLIERYIFLLRIRKIKKIKAKNSEKRDAISHYFKEFLENID